MNDLQSSITELDNFKKKIADQPMLSEEDLAEFERLKKKVEDASQALKNFSSSAKGMKGVSIEKEISKINQTLNQNPKYSKAAKEALHELLQELESGVSTKGLDEIHQKLLQIQNDEEKAGRSGKGLIDVIKEKQWYGFAAQIAGMFSFYDVINVAKSGVSTIMNLDEALVDLKKTTTMSSDQLKQYYFDSNDVAKQMGVTTQEIIDQSSAWSRLGYSTAEASTTMAKLSSQFASISPGMETDEAQSGLVSIMKAWNIDPKDVKSQIMDPINQLGKIIAQTYSTVWCYLNVA